MTDLASTAVGAAFNPLSLIPAGISAIAGLFGQSSADKKAQQDRAEAIRQFNAQLAQQAAQFGTTSGQNQQQIDYSKLTGDRNYASTQDDKARGIADQRALNPRRAEMMAMLMKRFGSQTPGLTATAPGSYGGGNSNLPIGV